MKPQLSLGPWRPISSLAVCAFALGLVCYGVLSTAADLWQASVDIAGLRESERAAREEDSKAKATAPTEVADQALVAPDSEAALSVIQQRVRRLIEPPATLDMLHSLDISDERGMVAVRASFRISALMPDHVLALIKSLETSKPAILIDDIRIDIQTRPAPIGINGPATAGIGNAAEVTGILRVYAAKRLDPAAAAANSGKL